MDLNPSLPLVYFCIMKIPTHTEIWLQMVSVQKYFLIYITVAHGTNSKGTKENTVESKISFLSCLLATSLFCLLLLTVELLTQGI